MGWAGERTDVCSQVSCMLKTGDSSRSAYVCVLPVDQLAD